MYSLTKETISIATAGAALFLAAPAIAQETRETDAKSGLGEIIVTARKTAERLQDVPVSVSSFGTDYFEKKDIAGLEDLNLAVPNMTITRNNTGSNGAQVFIRGIGRDNSTWNEESGVAIYVDDVYLSQQIGSLLDFVEFERIEVLRGPQGTLYGRNATGGAVKFVVKRPSFMEPVTFVGDIALGKFGQFDVRGSVGAVLVQDKLAAKVDFVTRSLDGYVTRPETSKFVPGEILNGRSRQTGRLSLLWNATEDFEVYLTGTINRANDDINSPIPLIIGGPNGGKPLFGSKYIADPGVPNDTRNSAEMLTAQLTWGVGDLELKSITAWRHVNDLLRGDLDGIFYIPIDFDQVTEFRTVSQEFQLLGNLSESLNFVAGLYFFQEKLHANSLNVFLGNLRSLSDQTTRSYAGYADGTWQVTDKLSLFGGIRLTHDKKHIRQSVIAPGGAFRFKDGTGEKGWTQVSPRVGAQYQITPDAMVYANWGRGFKSGAVVNGRPSEVVTATTFTNPELSTTAEIGVKTEWFDRRLRLNLAGFHTSYSNLQSSYRDPVTNFMGVVAADARIDGVELEAEARPTRNLTLSGTLGILKSKYVNVDPAHPVYPVRDSVTLKQIPDFNYRIGFEYVLPLSVMKGQITLGGDVLHSSETPRDIFNSPLSTTPAYTTLDMRVAYETVDKRWRLSAKMENMTATDYWTMGTAPFARFYAPERVWSVTLRYRM